MKTGRGHDLKPSHVEDELEEGEERNVEVDVVVTKVLSSQQARQEERVDGDRDDLQQQHLKVSNRARQ